MCKLALQKMGLLNSTREKEVVTGALIKIQFLQSKVFKSVFVFVLFALITVNMLHKIQKTMSLCCSDYM